MEALTYERSFSEMIRIKTWLRNSLWIRQRFTKLTLLRIKMDIKTNLCVDNSLIEFVETDYKSIS